MVDRSLYCELLPVDFSDDIRYVYPGYSHSYSNYSSVSLPSLPVGVGISDRCWSPVGRWLAPQRILCTLSIEVQTDCVHVWEEGVGTQHTVTYWR